LKYRGGKRHPGRRLKKSSKRQKKSRRAKTRAARRRNKRNKRKSRKGRKNLVKVERDARIAVNDVPTRRRKLLIRM